jgi:hypothetical protein
MATNSAKKMATKMAAACMSASYKEFTLGAVVQPKNTIKADLGRDLFRWNSALPGVF